MLKKKAKNMGHQKTTEYFYGSFGSSPIKQSEGCKTHNTSDHCYAHTKLGKCIDCQSLSDKGLEKRIAQIVMELV